MAKQNSATAFYRNLGNAIRLARSAANRSQEDLAEVIDVSPQQIQKYEKGQNRIPVQHLVSISDYLEVPLSQLVSTSTDEADFQALAAQFGSKEFHVLMEAWVVLKDRPARAALINLVKCMANLNR